VYYLRRRRVQPRLRFRHTERSGQFAAIAKGPEGPGSGTDLRSCPGGKIPGEGNRIIPHAAIAITSECTRTGTGQAGPEQLTAGEPCLRTG